MSFVLTRYKADTIVLALASCFATLPNLTTIQGIVVLPSARQPSQADECLRVVIRANQAATTIRKAFQSKQFPSVRRVSLPSCAHDILHSCPNIEEVTCTEGSEMIVRSLVKGNFPRLGILRGVCQELKGMLHRYWCMHMTWSEGASMTGLAKLPPNLTHIGFPMGVSHFSVTNVYNAQQARAGRHEVVS